MNEEQIRQLIREEMSGMLGYVFSKHIRILDGRNIQTGRTTGTQIGTETSQKIGFFGKTPAVQQDSIAAAPSMSGTYVQSEQVAQCNRITNLITTLRNLGLIA